MEGYLYKSGIGFDAHAFAEGRKLILGGVEIDYTFGLLGHSDADVLSHAVIDSLAGNCLGKDIGMLFADTDMRYKDISSLKLVSETAGFVRAAGYEVLNIDTVVIAQEPKLTPHKDEMRINVAKALGVDEERISVKATTTEYLGFTGRKEGICAVAVSMCRKIK